MTVQCPCETVKHTIYDRKTDILLKIEAKTGTLEQRQRGHVNVRKEEEEEVA